MFFGCYQLVIVFLSIIISAVNTSNHQSSSSPPLDLSSSISINPNECQSSCSIDYCLQYQLLNKNCSKLIRDQCDCCTVCLRTEHEICGGHLNVYGLCEQDLLCYQTNQTVNDLNEQTGVCMKGNWRKTHYWTGNNQISIPFSMLEIPVFVYKYQ